MSVMVLATITHSSDAVPVFWLSAFRDWYPLPAKFQEDEVPGGTGNPAYTKALAVLDEDMDQYIHDNTDEEFTHFTFINAYLVSKGPNPSIWTSFVLCRAVRRLAPSKSDGSRTLQTRPPPLTIVEKRISSLPDANSLKKDDKEQTCLRSREQQAEIETASASNGSEWILYTLKMKYERLCSEGSSNKRVFGAGRY
jgi:hypothetical protein